MVADNHLVRDSCLGLMRRDHRLCKEVAKAEARGQTTWVQDLEDRVKVLQTDLTSSSATVAELEKKSAGLGDALMVEERASCLAEREARSVVEAACPEGRAQTLQMQLKEEAARAAAVEE